ncbi:MAG: DinB family protein [Chloroflexota bacterium]|nr:DinB family protein [Chloroflexota bacterium]
MEPAVESARTQLKLIHDGYRETVRGMDKAGLNWRPGAETNSAAALVIHVAASEAAILNAIKGNQAGPRDMAAEFHATAESDTELLARLDEMDVLFDQIGPSITAADLAAPRQRPNGTQTGLYWLIHAVGHGREHLGHIQLTKQLYAARAGA